MSQRNPIEVFPPGDFIREELEERGWTQEVLAEVLGTSLRLVNEIITGKRAITPATARALGEAFDTGPAVWMNLESAFRLSQVRPRDDMVARRAKWKPIAILSAGRIGLILFLWVRVVAVEGFGSQNE